MHTNLVFMPRSYYKRPTAASQADVTLRRRPREAMPKSEEYIPKSEIVEMMVLRYHEIQRLPGYPGIELIYYT